MTRKGAKVAGITRPFEISYGAGWWSGYALTRENAIIAAVKHVVRDSYNRATITDRRTNEVVARVTINDDRTTATVRVTGAGLW